MKTKIIISSGNTHGFTLVEIMIVILIMSLLLLIAVPSWLVARERTQAKSCTSQLRKIKYAKESWAMENCKDSIATPSMDQIMEYLKTKPECPAGGSYTLGMISEEPTCSVGGDHVLY